MTLTAIKRIGVFEANKWCNSFVLVPKPNEKVQLCLVPVRLNQAIIHVVHSSPIVNDIFSELICATYLTIIDASSGCHNLNFE